VMMEPAGNSLYNSLQLTAEKRFSRGFTVLANYTFAKTIDNNVGSANKGNGTTVTNPYNQAYDRLASVHPHLGEQNTRESSMMAAKLPTSTLVY
jgi:Leu/Phe-tRNA-protein transferase